VKANMNWQDHANQAQTALQRDDFSAALDPLEKARNEVKKMLSDALDIIKRGEMQSPTATFAALSKDYSVSLSKAGYKSKSEEVALDTWDIVSQYIDPPPSSDRLFVDRMMGAGEAHNLMMTLFIEMHQNRNLPDGRSFREYAEESTDLLQEHQDKFRRLAESLN
jgi:hypothetical protein